MLESQHYDYYNQGADFSVKTEDDPVLTFPEYLNIYTFEESNDSRFPTPKKGSTEVLGQYSIFTFVDCMSIRLWFCYIDYYLLDGASILPVLALDLQHGDVVLDMCAAPGGKTLTILQTLLPRLMVANDMQLSRVKRIKNVINQYVNGIGQGEDKLYVTRQDARVIGDKDIFNKVILFPSPFSLNSLIYDEV